MSKVIKPIPLTFVIVLILYFSLKAPSSEVSSINNFDKFGHFLAYFSLSVSIYLATRSKNKRYTLLFLGVLMGVLLEVIQGTLQYRQMSVADGITNTIGVIVGALFFNIFFKQISYILGKLKLKNIFID